MKLDEKYSKLIGYFKEISKIPRNSKKEEKIANYLCDFAKSRNLEFKKDESNNVLIKKKASIGFENKRTIMLQAHTDMVCEKESNSTHDFDKDPIDIIENKSTLTANGTTLGADDGIGVAFLMLLLDDDEINHPDIECIFTTQEEIGMYGAKAFDYSDIKASYLINLDGEEENTAIVGCAGGVSINYTKSLDVSSVENNVYKLSISGLYGGHSGVDIDKNRVNSNYLAAEILDKLANVEIISFIGGNKDNAIANSTDVVFSTTTDNVEEKLNSVLSKFKFTKEDRNVKADIEKLEDNIYRCIDKEESNNIISLILGLKQGVIEISKDIEDLVETSGNIGIVRVEDGKVRVTESLRSSVDAKKEKYKNENNALALRLGFEIEEEGEYPGWKYNPNSNIQKVYIDAYKKSHNGQEPIVCAIHAGVECGLIYEKLPHLDMISLGPDVKDVHTVNETLYLDSCRKMLQTLIYIIDNLD